jgi:hypothetical protein
MRNIWKKIKKWGVNTALPWLKKSWMRIIDLILFFIVYGTLDNAGFVGLSALIGFWIFILLGYYIFWQFFGAGKMIKKHKK